MTSFWKPGALTSSIAVPLLACSLSLLAGCSPSTTKLCERLGEYAEQHQDQTGQPWVQTLDTTLSDPKQCAEYLDYAKGAHAETWDDLALCFARARSWSDVETCDRVLVTLDVAGLCYHIVDASSDDEDGTTGAEQDGHARVKQEERRRALIDCAERERTRLRAGGAHYSSYVACVRAAETPEAIAACRDEADAAAATVDVQ